MKGGREEGGAHPYTALILIACQLLRFSGLSLRAFRHHQARSKHLARDQMSFHRISDPFGNVQRIPAGKLLLCTIEVESCEGRKLWMSATVTDGPNGKVRISRGLTILARHLLSPVLSKCFSSSSSWLPDLSILSDHPPACFIVLQMQSIRLFVSQMRHLRFALPIATCQSFYSTKAAVFGKSRLVVLSASFQEYLR